MYKKDNNTSSITEEEAFSLEDIIHERPRKHEDGNLWELLLIEAR
jgi:hypothetical protein